VAVGKSSARDPGVSDLSARRARPGRIESLQCLGGWGLVFETPAEPPGVHGLVAVVWIVTFGLAVPAHETLQAGGPEPAVIARLIAANGIRTVAWTLAFLVLLAA
jgi:hypothetical protein